MAPPVTKELTLTASIDVTLDDPKVSTEPWTVTLHMKPLVGNEKIDFMCQANSKGMAHMVR